MNTLTITGLDKPLVQLSPDALRVKTLAIEACQDVQAVENSLDVEVASTVLRDVAKLVKDCEQTRVKIKAPVLDLARQIDDVAKTYSSDLEKQSTRIKGLVGAYHARQEEIQRAAERKRQEELARIERERIDAERKAAAEAARIERERLAAEAEARRAAMEAARKAASIEEAEAAAQAADAAAKKAADDAKAAAAALEAKQRAEALERAKQAAAVAPVARIEKQEGVSVSSVWKFEVLDIAEVYKANPTLVVLSPSTSAINAAIKAGHKTIPGLRIWEEKGVKVRG